jgi:mRNA interferase MazF
MIRRGDVVLVEIPFHDRPGSKERPAVVIQCDRNNRRILSTLVIGLTSNISRVETEPTQFLIDPGCPDGALSGLSIKSAAKCENIFTVSQSRIRRVLGRLSATQIAQLNLCLTSALDLG